MILPNETNNLILLRCVNTINKEIKGVPPENNGIFNKEYFSWLNTTSINSRIQNKLIQILQHDPNWKNYANVVYNGTTTAVTKI